jgi:hypothetical protein
MFILTLIRIVNYLQCHLSVIVYELKYVCGFNLDFNLEMIGRFGADKRIVGSPELVERETVAGRLIKTHHMTGLVIYIVCDLEPGLRVFQIRQV